MPILFNIMNIVLLFCSVIISVPFTQFLNLLVFFFFCFQQVCVFHYIFCYCCVLCVLLCFLYILCFFPKCCPCVTKLMKIPFCMQFIKLRSIEPLSISKFLNQRVSYRLLFNYPLYLCGTRSKYYLFLFFS